jgi:hypothetical protein
MFITFDKKKGTINELTRTNLIARNKKMSLDKSAANIGVSVINIENNKIIEEYLSLTAAALAYSVNSATIARMCLGITKNSRKLPQNLKFVVSNKSLNQVMWQNSITNDIIK